jgi:hypothetical protein
MGFSASPPKFDTATQLRDIDLFSARAELVIVQDELPWTDLLAGTAPDAIIDQRYSQLVAYFRSKGLKLVYVFDLDNGLARGQEAPQLAALGRSIVEPAVQQAYRDWVAAVVRRLAPDYVGLAAETNLIRAAGTPSHYAAVVKSANDAAHDLRAAGVTTPLFVSVQIETAWGFFTKSAYLGIDADLADFPFLQMLGYSSYPYFFYADPNDIPADYYTRVLSGRPLPVMVVEGGWNSASVGGIVSSPEKQARYITRQAELLDSVHAIGVIQLLFADYDLSLVPPATAAALAPFASIGITDSDFNPKPALAAWDALFGRHPRRSILRREPRLVPFR